MPDSCSVYGCSNRKKRDKDKRFFRIPREVSRRGEKAREFSKKRRERWFANLSLLSKGLESPHARVCSDHFVKGCPSDLLDENDVDWAPTLNLGHSKVRKKPESAVKRDERTVSREVKRRHSEAASALLELQKGADKKDQENHSDPVVVDFHTAQETTTDRECQTDVPLGAMTSTECQTELTGLHLKQMEEDFKRLNLELYSLKEKSLDSRLSKDAFEDNDEKTRFYTGLPSFLVLMQVFNICEPWISHTHRSALDKFEQLLLVLMRLRLNLSLQDLAFRFGISLMTASRICHKVITVMHERLDFLIEWPEREALWTSMPMDFRKSFGSKVAVIIDCFEIFIERPSNLLARAQTWSNYKHHNTVKFLIGVAPQGVVTFISDAWGGRVSDKKITEESGFLNHLLPGDMVLADRGFNIEDSVGLHCATLKIPAFTKGKSQLTACEVEETRKIANVRIHVERVIGLVRRKYQVLQSRALPIEYMQKKPGDSKSLIDKIGVICCALTNLSESIVPLE